MDYQVARQVVQAYTHGGTHHQRPVRHGKVVVVNVRLALKDNFGYQQASRLVMGVAANVGECRRLLCAKDAVSRIPQARQDVAVVVQLAVHRSGVHRYIRMRLVHRCQSFRAGQQAQELDRFRL